MVALALALARRYMNPREKWLKLWPEFIEPERLFSSSFSNSPSCVLLELFAGSLCVFAGRMEGANFSKL